ncbi:hypothetical protein Hanom_Chr05g00411141 [Helianthus anomalus]
MVGVEANQHALGPDQTTPTMANRAGDKKQKDNDVEPIRLRRSLLHDAHSQLVTYSTTRTTVRPRGSNHCAPTSLSSASTNGRVR